MIMQRNTGRVLSQSLREEGSSGRARSDRLVKSGPSFGEGAGIRVRRCDRREWNIEREGVQLLGKSLGGIVTIFSHNRVIRFKSITRISINV